MELTISNLIKIIIAAIVIVVVILGVYFAMKFYIIPYFEGIKIELGLNLIKNLNEI